MFSPATALFSWTISSAEQTTFLVTCEVFWMKLHTIWSWSLFEAAGACVVFNKKKARLNHQEKKVVVIWFFFLLLPFWKTMLSVQFTITLQHIRKPQMCSTVILDKLFSQRGQEPKGHKCSQALKLLLQERRRHAGGSVCIALILAKRLSSPSLMIPYRNTLIPIGNSPWLQNGPQLYFLVLVKIVNRLPNFWK